MEKEIRCAMEHLSNVDPIMHSIMVRHQWECPIGQQSKTIYELFIGAIIGQKIRFFAARYIRQKLYKHLGEITPSNLEKTSDQDLQEIGLGTSISIIRRFHSHYLLKFPSENPSSDQLKQFCLECKQVKGIGDWTVNNVLIMSGLDLDVFLTGDKFIQRKFDKFYPNQNINNVQLKWAPYRSVAMWFLWRP